MEQKINPCKGDWVTLIEADMNDFQITMDEKKIQSLSVEQYKKVIMEKIRQKAFFDQRKIQKSHMKVKYINYKDLSGPQNYLGHRSFSNKLTSLLFDLRCRNVRSIKDNFHRQYKGEILCPFLCITEIDSQEHLLSCQPVLKHLSDEQRGMLVEVKYEHLFGTTLEQLKVTQMFHILLKIRHRLLDDDQRPAYHGNNSGPSY